MSEREYSPQRATRVAAASSLGTMLVLGGLFVGGGDAAGSPATSTHPLIDPVAGAAPLATVPPVTPATVTVASLDVPTSETTPACTNTYIVQPGDYWLLLAREANVPVDSLYSLNGADPSSALFPGQVLCVPEGASVVTTSLPVATVPPTTKRAVATRSPQTVAPAPVVTVAQTTRSSR